MQNATHRIEAEQLLPGTGAPLRDACLIIEDGRVAWVGPRASAPATAAGVPVWRTQTILPGLWDCHVHLTGLRTTSLDDAMRVPPPVCAARAVMDAQKALDAGFTSVREVGGYGVHVARVVDEGTAPGPTIYAAGDLISQTGGHADLHTYSVGCVTHFAEQGGWLRTCDGEAECLRAVRLQLRRNCKLIKICASGGVLTEYDDPMHQQFTDRELRVIVEEAARAERVVAAHCHGKAGILAALRAGAKTIEHGTYLDAETADVMKEVGAVLVTTRFVTERMLAYGQATGLPSYAWDKLVAMGAQHREAVALAIRSGVTIALGTDTITTGEGSALPWGLHARELELLVDAGMTPLQAIEAATANAPLTVGAQARRAGRLEVGWDADVILVDGDPLADVGVLTDRAKITHVLKRGHVEKAPTPSPA
ncbi:MAG: amidohydrolase family protein [Sandaracinaceae bacterium]|nr:amidohydrolase family protein [Sandaracinaceae bacterium]